MHIGLVRKPEIDLVDDERAAASRDDARDPLELVPCHRGAGGVGRRGDQRATRAWCPVSLDERRGQLVARVGPDGYGEHFAFERAYDVAVAGIPRIGEQDLVVAVDE